MNQNTYTIRVKKARSLTILPQLRNMFPRELMAANANNETILMEKVSAVILKKIIKETDVYVDINEEWVHIPVRTPENTVDDILSQPVVEKVYTEPIVDDQKEETPYVAPVEEPKESQVIAPVEVEEQTIPEPVVVEEQKEEKLQPIEMKEVVEQQVPQEDFKVPYKSIPRNNNNGKNNNHKK